MRVGVERYIWNWRFLKGKSETIEARKSDKVILKLKDGLVITGFVFEVGTKNLTLKTGSNLIGKMTTYLDWRKIKINDIEKFAKYPKEAQEYKSVKLY